MAKQTYELVGWTNESEGATPTSAENFAHMDEAIKYLYDEGATSKDIFICGENQTIEDAPEEAKIIIDSNIVNAKPSEIVNSMEGNEIDKGPSVNAVKKYINGVVAYFNEDGTKDNITLDYDTSKYSQMIIYYKGAYTGTMYSTTMYNPSGKTINTGYMEGKGNTTYWRASSVNVSGKNITRNDGTIYDTYNLQPKAMPITDDWYPLITRIELYKEVSE